MGGVIAGVTTVDSGGMEPEPGRNHFRDDAFPVQPLLQFTRFLEDLRCGFLLQTRDDIVVMEHHCIEAKGFQGGQFPVKRLGWAGGGPVGVLTFTEIPGAGAEAVLGSWHSFRWRECGNPDESSKRGV